MQKFHKFLKKDYIIISGPLYNIRHLLSLVQFGIWLED